MALRKATRLYQLPVYARFYSLLPADAALAINTVNEYMIALDQGDAKRFAKLFVDGGTCEVKKIGSVATGVDELSGLCMALSARFKGTQHLEYNPTLTATDDPNILTNESYWHAVANGGIVSMGIHTDVLQRQINGQWKFRSRIIWHSWTKAGGPESDGAGTWEGVVPQWK